MRVAQYISSAGLFATPHSPNSVAELARRPSRHTGELTQPRLAVVSNPTGVNHWCAQTAESDSWTGRMMNMLGATRITVLIQLDQLGLRSGG